MYYTPYGNIATQQVYVRGPGAKDSGTFVPMKGQISCPCMGFVAFSFTCRYNLRRKTQKTWNEAKTVVPLHRQSEQKGWQNKEKVIK